jgi:hypothetical protein
MFTLRSSRPDGLTGDQKARLSPAFGISAEDGRYSRLERRRHVLPSARCREGADTLEMRGAAPKRRFTEMLRRPSEEAFQPVDRGGAEHDLEYYAGSPHDDRYDDDDEVFK